MFLQEDVEDLITLQEDIEDAQFWIRPAKNTPTDILIPAHSNQEVADILRGKSMSYNTLINDVQVKSVDIFKLPT